MVKRTGQWLSNLEAQHAFVVLGALAIIVFFMSLGAAIGGSYLLTVSYVHQAQQARDQIQVEASIPQCTALVKLKEAGDKAVFYVPPGLKPSQTYGYQLSHAIDDVVKATRCEVLLKDVKEHKSAAQILHDLTPRTHHK